MMPISSSILDKVRTIQNVKMTNVILRRKPKDPCLTAGRSTGFFSASRRIRMTTQLSILHFSAEGAVPAGRQGSASGGDFLNFALF